MKTNYELLKDIPGWTKGTVFTETENVDKPGHGEGCITYSPPGVWLPQFTKSEMNNPRWFKEVKVITHQLNSEYEAEVIGDKVKVGCQEFEICKIRELINKIDNQ